LGKNKDGMAKNVAVVRGEWANWWQEMKDNTARFRYAGVINKGSRAPTGETNNNVFHLLTNYISESYRALPRTMTYATIIVILVTLFDVIAN